MIDLVSLNAMDAKEVFAALASSEAGAASSVERFSPEREEISSLAKNVERVVNSFGFDREGAAAALADAGEEGNGFKVAEAWIAALRRALYARLTDGRNEAAARKAEELGAISGFDEELARRAGLAKLHAAEDVEAAAIGRETDGATVFAGIAAVTFHKTLQQTFSGAVFRFVDLTFDSVKEAKERGELTDRWYAMPLV